MREHHLLKIRILFTGFLVLLAFSSTAQKGDLYRELRRYAYDYIHPELAKRKQMLEQELSRPEKSRIYDLQEEMVQIYRATNDDAFALNSGLSQGQQSLLDELFPFLITNQALIQSVLFEAWQIAERHEFTIGTILQEIRSKQEQWKSDMLKIVRKYETDDLQYKMDEAWLNKTYESFFTPANFILWRPEGLLFDFTDPYAEEETFTGISYYPNPVKDRLGISFELHRPNTEVYIAVFSSDGRLLKERKKDYSVAGLIKEEFDVLNVPSGGYFIRVSTTWDSATIRFTKT
jgi:hypothetical protein